MAEADSSYQEDTGHLRQGGGFYNKRYGISKFFDVDFTGQYLRNLFESFQAVPVNFTSVTMSNLNSRVTSLGTIVAATSNGVPGGVWHFSLATGNSLWSMSFPLVSGHSGTRLVLRGDACIADANIFVSIDTTGGSIAGMGGSDLSSMNLSAGFYVELVSRGGSTWAIVDRNESCTEQASA
jgi:hypothetical protein